MNFPALMPKELNPYLHFITENSLLAALIKQPNDLILFFETAVDDETWTNNHQEFIKKLLDWLTVQGFENRLVQSDYEQVARKIQKQYQFLKSLIPKNIVIKLKDAQIPINGLLLIASSDFFKQILLNDSQAKKRNYLSFPQMTTNEFYPIESSICTGTVFDLSIKGEKEIIDLLKQAKAWELSVLALQCEFTLPKYLIDENVFDRLMLARQERWPHFEQSCIQFINQKAWGFRLSSDSIERLAFEFLDFQDETIDFFEEIRPIITDIICSGNLVEQPQFGLILKESPHLFALDISRSSTFSNQFQEISKRLQILNVSECSWISKDTIKNIFIFCPELTHLFLRGNGHLNYIFFAELIKFKNLKGLDLSQCPQIQDSDLNLVLKGLNSLTELALSGCKKIDEKGFLDLAKNLPQLVSLDISHTNISDTAFVDIISKCRYLTVLDISSCSQITEKGILALVKASLSLKELNIFRCQVSPTTIVELRRTFPLLTLRA